LIQELADYEKEPDAVLVTADDLCGTVSVPTIISCFVAEVESEIVGIALYYYRYSTWKEK
jgi:hypothetical protein